MSRWELLMMAGKVMHGDYGNGDERKRRLGSKYRPIQKVVDTIIMLEDEESYERERWNDEVCRPIMKMCREEKE